MSCHPEHEPDGSLLGRIWRGFLLTAALVYLIATAGGWLGGE